MRAFWILLFWACAGTIAYVYLGYPCIMALWARLRPKPYAESDDTPSVTLIIAAYNEAACIAQKLENSLALDYPSNKLRIVVVADGSDDGTERLATSLSDPHVQVLHEPERQGKAAALARGAAAASSEVLVFTDANAMLATDALRTLLRPLADPRVAAVGGAKRTPEGGEGLYWRYENALKRWESAVGSVMGVPGELWAVRASLYQPPPSDTILDDWTASMRLVAQGWRVVHVPGAVAYEDAPTNLRAAWERRARNAAGGWQAIQRLGGPKHYADLLAWWQCFSHRTLRWMVVPWLWLPMLAASIALAQHPLYLGAVIAQWSLYDLAAMGGILAVYDKTVPWLTAPFYLLFGNAAAAAGGWRHLTGKQTVLWRKAR